VKTPRRVTLALRHSPRASANGTRARSESGENRIGRAPGDTAPDDGVWVMMIRPAPPMPPIVPGVPEPPPPPYRPPWPLLTVVPPDELEPPPPPPSAQSQLEQAEAPMDIMGGILSAGGTLLSGTSSLGFKSASLGGAGAGALPGPGVGTGGLY